MLRDEPEILPFSSWDTVYRSLCSMLPPERIRYGRSVTGFTQDADGIDVHYDGGNVRADVLIAADGTDSGVAPMPLSVCAFQAPAARIAHAAC